MKFPTPVVAVLVLVACGPPYPKQPPIDLVLAQGPAPSQLSAEATLEVRWDSEVFPFFAGAEEGSFDGVRGLTLRYRIRRASFERGAVVFIFGRTEASAKHAELFYDFARFGYSMFALDHRGQGASDRLLQNPQKGHVEQFQDYVDDLDLFVEKVVKPRTRAPLFLVAHSMGGAVAVLHRDQHPETWKAMALSSPMLELNSGSWPKPVAFTIGAGACSWTTGSDYALGYGDYKEDTNFAANSATHSEARWRLKSKVLNDDPALRVGGLTWRWLCEAFEAAEEARVLGPRSNTPTLLFAGGKDRVVGIDAERRYCEEAARCQEHFFPDAYHEIFIEEDSVRNVAVSEALRFFNHVGAR